MSSHHLIKAALEGDAELVAAVGGRIRVDFARENDAYPFVLTPAVIEKLGFVARIVRQAGSVQWTVPGPNGPIRINTPAG